MTTLELFLKPPPKIVVVTKDLPTTFGVTLTMENGIDVTNSVAG